MTVPGKEIKRVRLQIQQVYRLLLRKLDQDLKHGHILKYQILKWLINIDIEF